MEFKNGCHIIKKLKRFISTDITFTNFISRPKCLTNFSDLIRQRDWVGKTSKQAYDP